MCVSFTQGKQTVSRRVSRTNGWVGQYRRRLERSDDGDVAAFYDAHWHHFETDDEKIVHPTPIQGDWTVDAIDLPHEVLEKFYVENARRHLGL